MLTLGNYNTFCAALPHTTSVIQWGGSHVWKIGGKVFAIGSLDGERLAVSFKVTRLSCEILSDTQGCRPAPYLASRGMLWIQCHDEGLSEADLTAYIAQSYRLVAAGLPKKLQKQLDMI